MAIIEIAGFRSLDTDDIASHELQPDGKITYTLDDNSTLTLRQEDADVVQAAMGEAPSITTSTESQTAHEYSTEYGGADSKQVVAADMTLDAGAGTSDAGDSAYLAPFMGNVIGDLLTKTKNIIAGYISKLSVTGARASTYPVAGHVSEVGDGVTECDGGYVAVIGGDSAQTKGRAAYAVDYQNSTAGSGFDYFADAYHAAHDGYNAVTYNKGFMRIGINDAGEDVCIFFGTAATDANIVAQVGADNLWGDGSIYISCANGGGKFFMKKNDVWTEIA